MGVSLKCRNGRNSECVCEINVIVFDEVEGIGGLQVRWGTGWITGGEDAGVKAADGNWAECATTGNKRYKV